MSLLLLFGGGEQVAYVQPSVAVALTLKRRSTALTVASWDRHTCYVDQKQVFAAPGEGITLTVDVSNYTTPTAASVTVRNRHWSDVTSSFIPSGSASISTNTITLPELSIPATAIGIYSVDVLVEAGGYSPVVVRIPLDVSPMHQWLAAIGSPQTLRRGEGMAYAVTTTAWGGTPTSPSATVWRLVNGMAVEDVTSTFMAQGSHSIDGDNVTLKELQIPSAARLVDYRVDVQFNAGNYAPAVGHFIVGVGR